MDGMKTGSNPLNAGTPAAAFSESKTVMEDESGYRMELHEVAFNQINLKWGNYSNPSKRLLSFSPDTTTIVSHFRIKDPSSIQNVSGRIAENQFVLYQERPEPYQLIIPPTNDKTCSFFEAGMSDVLFQLLFKQESDCLFRFDKQHSVQTPSLEFTSSIAPRMHAIINDMYHTSYKGHLKNLYLETKTIELFLLQIEQFDQQPRVPAIKLGAQDIDRLYAIKEYLGLHFDQAVSITALAQRAGINSMKLKTGFKWLFNTTIFGYLHMVRMNEAKRLLMDEGLYVNEVAERVGYKHPHHFAAAFKKEFNITPGKLRK